MPGKKGKKKGKKKGSSKSKGDASDKKTVAMADPMPKPAFVPPAPFPGESLLKILTTHKVEEKEVHNIKVSTKILDELSPEDIRDLRQVHETFDANSDGLLIANELRQAFKILGFKISREEAKEMASEAGIARKSYPSVDFNDFLGFVIEKQGDSRDYQDEILQGFKMFDYEETGKITLENLRQAAQDAGVKLSEEDLRDMLQEADINGDNAIDQEEFVKIMMQTTLF